MSKNEEKIIEIDHYQKNKNRINIIDIIKAILLVAVFSVLGLWAYNNQDKLTAENAKVLLSYFDFKENQTSDLLADGITFTNGNENCYGLYDGNFCILTNDGFYAYQSDNSQKFVQLSFQNPVMLSGKKFLLLYDIGAADIRIANKDGIIKTLSFGHKITGASINDSGYFSVISGESGYLSQVSVFDRNMEKIFKWYSSEEYITCSDISPGDKTVCVASFSNEDAITGKVRFFSFENEEPLNVVEFDDDLVMDVKYKDTNLSVAVMSNKLAFFNGDGVMKNEYDYSDEYIWKYDLSPKYYNVLAFCKNSTGIGIDLKIIDNSGNIQGEYYTDGSVEKIVSDNDKIALLERGKITVLDTKGNLKEQITVNLSTEDILLDGSYVYVIAGGSVNRVKLN